MIVPVKKITIITFTEYVPYILGEMGKLGVIQLRRLAGKEYVERKFMGERVIGGEPEEYRKLYERFSKIYNELAQVMKIEGGPTEEVKSMPLDEVKGIIEELERSFEQLKYLNEIRPIIDAMAKHGINPGDLGETELVFSAAGIIKNESLPLLKAIEGRRDVSYKVYPLSDEESLLYVSGLFEVKPLVEKTLLKAGFRRIKLKPEVPKKADEARKWIEEQTETLKKRIQELIVETNYGKSIVHSMHVASAQTEIIRSKMISVIGGWVPEPKLPVVKSFIEKAKKRTKSIIIAYFEDPRPGEEPPTILKNPKFLKAYEVLTRQYGTPSHEEIDPTPALGIIWTILFGLMFPDAGQGIALIVLGYLFGYVIKKPIIGMRFTTIGKLMIRLGIAAFVTGLLVGEFFLMEIPPLFPGLREGWLHHPVYIIWLLKTSIFFGIASIITALILNIVNCLKAHEKVEALLGERGLPALLIFIGLVATIFSFTGMTIIPGVLRIPTMGMDALPFLGISIVGAVLLIVKSIVTREGAITSMGPIIEDFIGLFSNMISHLRIAGFALAHVALGAAVHEMMRVNPAIGIGMGLIFLNFFCLTIELMVVMIQALRLTYYEFATKFFRATGTPYKPYRA